MIVSEQHGGYWCIVFAYRFLGRRRVRHWHRPRAGIVSCERVREVMEGQGEE